MKKKRCVSSFGALPMNKETMDINHLLKIISLASKPQTSNLWSCLSGSYDAQRERVGIEIQNEGRYPFSLSGCISYHNHWICIPPAIHRFTTPNKCSFSSAALTLSLSASCLLTACSLIWVPLSILTTTLKREGRDRKSLTRMDRPIKVAMEQWGI